MADEKRSLILDLLARNKMRKDTNEAADDLDKLGNAAEDADKKTKGLGETSEKTSQKTDRMGNSLSETKGRISGLDKEIATVDKELKGLSASFADAGSSAERNDISKAIRRTQTELRNLTKNRDVLKSLLPDDKEVDGWGKRFVGKASTYFKSLGEFGGPEIATSLAAASPLIGAVVSGAVIGGAGIGGVVGGLIIAAKDPRVQTAAGDLKSTIGTELKYAAEPFVPVAIGAIGRVEEAFNKIDFRGAFASAAKNSAPLIDGIISGFTKIGGAVADLIKKSGPELEAIGNGIDKIGGAVANGLEEISSNGKASTEALNDFFSLVSGGITVVFKLVDGLTKVYGALHDSGEAIGELIGGGLKDLGVQGEAVHGTMRKVADSEVEAAVNANKLKDSQNAAAAAEEQHKKAAQDLNNELKAQVDPEFALLNAVDQVKDAHKAAADAAKRYGSNSEQARAATRQLAEAAIVLQGAATGAGGSINGRLTPAMRNTLRAAGLTKGEIHDVEVELNRARVAAQKYAHKYYAEIITNYTYNVGGNDYNREANRAAFSGKRAAGGPIVRGMPYLVGENGPEIVVPDASGRVLSAGASRGLVAQGAVAGMRGTGSGGGNTRTVELEVYGEQYVASFVKRLIRRMNVIEG